MEILTFDLRGSLAHFRKPDTTATHVTFPFITRTALRGLIGSILGLEEYHGNILAGIQLLSPVRRVSQELSLLGKAFLGDGGNQFNRPTAIELLVNPHYRIYCQGDEVEELAERIGKRQSVYHTYLGSAFALTVPEYISLSRGEEIDPGKDWVTSVTVIPTHFIESLSMEEGNQYGRAGGFHYEHLGNRRFQGSVHLLYEVNGRPIRFIPKANPSPAVKMVRLENGEVITLW